MKEYRPPLVTKLPIQLRRVSSTTPSGECSENPMARRLSAFYPISVFRRAAPECFLMTDSGHAKHEPGDPHTTVRIAHHMLVVANHRAEVSLRDAFRIGKKSRSRRIMPMRFGHLSGGRRVHFCRQLPLFNLPPGNRRRFQTPRRD